MIAKDHFVFDTFLVFQNPPALQAENITIAFGSRVVQVSYKCLPLDRVTTDIGLSLEKPLLCCEVQIGVLHLIIIKFAIQL